jgi:hypothetical protein
MKLLMESWNKFITEDEGGGQDRTNIAAVPAKDIVTQLANGVMDGPVVKALADYFNPQYAQPLGGVQPALTPEYLKAFVDSIGAEALVKRITYIQDKLPTKAPAKAEMPALEPKDAENVKDALSDKDGGAMAIDFNDPLAEDLGNVNFNDPRFPSKYTSGMPDDVKNQFLSKGAEKSDGQAGDDVVGVLIGQSCKASEMNPTQSNILLGKSLAFGMSGGFAGKNLDGFATMNCDILDGHHRWSGTILASGDGELGGITKVDAPAEIAIPMLRAIGNAFGNAQK